LLLRGSSNSGCFSLEPGEGIVNKSSLSVPLLESWGSSNSLNPGDKVAQTLKFLLAGEEGKVGVASVKKGNISN